MLNLLMIICYMFILFICLYLELWTGMGLTVIAILLQIYINYDERNQKNYE